MKLTEKMQWIIFHMRRGWTLYEMDGQGVADKESGFYMQSESGDEARKIHTAQVKALEKRGLVKRGRGLNVWCTVYELTKKGREAELS